MLVLISYDVNTQDRAGQKRLRQIAKACQNRGIRVQYSVFECEVTPAEWVFLRERLLGLMDPGKDSLRFYQLGTEGHRRIEHVGCKVPLNLEGPLLL